MCKLSTASLPRHGAPIFITLCLDWALLVETWTRCLAMSLLFFSLSGLAMLCAKNRPFKTDLEAMLCAEGVAFARSSLALFISAHGRASYYYIPWECGPGTYQREDRTNESPKIVQDNTTLLAIEKPNAQVRFSWCEGGSRWLPLWGGTHAMCKCVSHSD